MPSIFFKPTEDGSRGKPRLAIFAGLLGAALAAGATTGYSIGGSQEAGPGPAPAPEMHEKLIEGVTTNILGVGILRFDALARSAQPIEGVVEDLARDEVLTIAKLAGTMPIVRQSADPATAIARAMQAVLKERSPRLAEVEIRKAQVYDAGI